MSGPATPAGSVWTTLVGQAPVVRRLERAVAGEEMSHAWLFTGPPGSGRSNAAMAFAAALQCDQAGCGECHACRTALAGSHGDVSVTRTEKLSIGVDEVRHLVRRASLAPAGHRWQVMIVEDADRLTEHAANALLKAIEEPTRRTAWLLCAPTVEDVLPTIRSRCRSVVLRTPLPDAVTDYLVDRQGVPEAIASYAARASQGHIGRAKALALDENTRRRRHEVVSIPTRLNSLGACMNAAANLVDVAREETDAVTGEINGRERSELEGVYGSDLKARRSRAYKAAFSDLAKSQTARGKRRVLDVIDRCMMDMLSVYRDAIAVQVGARVSLVNEEMRADVAELARLSTPERNLRRIDAMFRAREQMLEHAVPPLLALESMMLALRVP